MQQNSTYSLIMPKVQLTPLKQKTKKEEIKEIIQNPNDPLAKYPLRAFGYSNEVGAAVSAMPVWGKAAEAALWVPALMYLGADIYDKYRRGKEGDYTKASSSAAVEQATFQALASVILPTAAVKMGQSIAGQFAKLDGTSLNASVKEELISKLSKDFDKGKFTRGNFYNEKGELVLGIDRAVKKVINFDYLQQLNTMRTDLKHEKFHSKLFRFFGHSDKPFASAKANEELVKKFLSEKTKEIFNLQQLLESGSYEEIRKSPNKKIIKLYEKSLKNLVKNTELLISEDPAFILKKILNANDPNLSKFDEQIRKVANDRAKFKELFGSRNASSKLLKKLMSNPQDAEILRNYIQRVERVRLTIGKYISNKNAKLGLLKTAGGFIALGCLAVPIDHFVHKYIIKKFVEPGLENVKNLHSRLSFKKSDKN